jgi:L-lysine 6-transaminase
MYFTKFDWPRVRNPKLTFPITPAEQERVAAEEQRAVRDIEAAFAAHPDDICAILIEPIQAEGGDNHFRAEFLRELRRLCDVHEALLIFDEVQTGLGTTGKMWAFEHFGVVPDALAFGKKVQMGGCWVGPRLDEVEDNVFRVPSRINSTWGGNLADMLRSTRMLEVIASDGLVDNAARVGQRLLSGLEAVAARYPDRVSNARGRGFMAAFDLPDKSGRDALRRACFDRGLLLLGCGERSIRFRPALIASDADIDEALQLLDAAIAART